MTHLMAFDPDAPVSSRVVESPIGPLRLLASDQALVAVEFHPFVEGDVTGDVAPAGKEHSVLDQTVEQLEAYFAGLLTTFDLPLGPRGTEYQRRVWEALLDVPYGTTATYGEIAVRLGQAAGASRAVGLANGRNPIPVVVPCHRVIGANGTLTGYAGGLERKQVLLELERREESTLF